MRGPNSEPLLSCKVFGAKDRRRSEARPLQGPRTTQSRPEKTRKGLDSFCPSGRGKIPRMKLTTLFTGRDEGEVLAYFGQARLLKRLDGKLELVGGTEEDRTSAREWISMFFHEALLREEPRR